MLTNWFTRTRRVISLVLALALVLTVVGPFAVRRTSAASLTAEGASFVHRSDGVWLWPLSKEAYNCFTDWAGCNGDWSCYFHPGDNHGGCEAAHETSDGFGHNGIDVGVVETVYAMADGTAYTREDGIRGKYVIIEHPIGVGSDGKNWSYYSYYQHLASFSVGNNVPVKAGDAIGVSGSTGASTGAHLHLGIVLGHSGSCDSLQSLENAGWVTSAGYQRGRILNNPARNSPSGYPTGYYVSNVYAHAGSVMYTFNKNEVNIGENTSQACNHNYVGKETSPNCEESGFTIYTCSKCGDSYTESIPALGHDYQGVETAPTCSSMGFVTYTCSRCGDSYTENDEESWSDWSVVYPEGISDGLIQEKTEYRYRDKEFTTSTSDELDGWTLIGSATIYGDYGVWSAWGDTPVSASDERKVETRTVWPYYYFLCGNCGAHMHGYGSCYTWAGGCGAATYESGWRELWSTTSWDNAGFGDWYGTGKYYAYVDGQLVFKLTGVSAKTQYRYCTREIVEGYSFYRWGEWSDWSDEAYTASDDREVESRTVYRYYTGPLSEHDWDDGIVTEEPTCDKPGIKTFTCSVCGETKTETVAALGHTFGEWIVIQAPTTTGYGIEERTCTRCGHAEQRIVAKLDNPFTDVTPGSYFYEPVLWALKNGITSGTSATTFSPDSQCVRSQVVTFLWRAAGSPEPTRTDNPFVDVKSTDYFYKPVLWALENGITSGVDATHFGSEVNCSREQVVTFLYQAKGRPAINGTANPFTDVVKGSYYEKPVLWALENGVTSGMGNGTFGVNVTCTRAQIVTFLYKAFVG